MKMTEESKSKRRIRKQILDLREQMGIETYNAALRLSRMRDELAELLDLYDDLTT